MPAELCHCSLAQLLMLGDPFITIFERANNIDFGSDTKTKWNRLVLVSERGFNFDVNAWRSCPKDFSIDQKLSFIGFDFVFQERFLQKKKKKYKAHKAELCTLYHLSLGSWILLGNKDVSNLSLMFRGLLEAFKIEESEFCASVLIYAFQIVAVSYSDVLSSQLFDILEEFCRDNVRYKEVVLSMMWNYLKVVAGARQVPVNECLDLILRVADENVNPVFLLDIVKAIAKTDLLYETECLKLMCRIMAKTQTGAFGMEFVSVCDSLFDPEKHTFQQVAWPEGSDSVLEIPEMKNITTEGADCVFNVCLDRLLEFGRIKLPEDLDFWNLYVPKEIQNVIGVLTEPKTAHHYHTELLSSMLNGLNSRIGSPYFAAYACIFVGMCYQLSSSETECVSLFLLKSSVFDSKITFFEEKEFTLSEQLVSSIRNKAVESIANCRSSGLRQVAELFMQNPMMISEIFQRLMSKVENLVVVFNDIASASVLHKFLSHYYSLGIAHPEWDEVSWSIVSVISTIVSVLLSDVKGRELLLSSSCFHPLFYGVFYLTSIRPKLMEKARTMFRELPFETVINTKVFFSTMLERLTRRPLDRPTTSLIVDMLLLLSEGGRPSERERSAVSLTSIVEIIMLFLSRLKQSEFSKEVFFAALECMSALGATAYFTNDMVGKMEECIIELFGPDSNDERLYLQMLQLLKGKVEDPVSPNFGVENGETLKLLVDVFVDSSQLSERFVKFFSSLLLFKMNVEKCRKHDIDILILKKISTLKSKEEASHKELVSSLLKIFRSIANIYSSTRTVKQYLQLLTPIREGVISVYQECFLREFKRIVMDAYYQGFVSESRWTFNATEEMRNKGFALSLWLRPLVDVSQDIAQASFGETEIRISVSNYELSMVITEKNEEIAKQTGIMKLEEGIWNLVLISCSVVNGNTKVVPQIGTNIFTPFVVPMLSVVDDMTVALLCDKSQVEVGNCKLTELMDTKEITQLSYENPISTELSRRDQVRSGVSAESTTFVQLLINAWKMEVALPVFSLWNCQLERQGSYPEFPRQTVDLFTRILVYSVDVQEYFATKELFDIISGIFTSSRYDESIINYRLYGDFHSMFVVLTSLRCKKSLFSAILVNPSIWVVASADDYLKIIRHWTRCLFPSFVDHAYEERSFDFMLDFSFIYFPYVNLPLMLDQRNGSRSCPRVHEIRNELHHLLLHLAERGFTRATFYNIFYQCMGFTDVKHSEFCMFLMNSIVSAYPWSLSESNITGVDIMSLAHLFKSKSPDIVQNVIEVIVNVYKTTKILDGASLTTYLHLVLWSLSTEKALAPSQFQAENSHPRELVIMSPAVYSRLLKLMLLSVSELVAICSWYAVNNGEDAIAELVSFLPEYRQMANVDDVFIWLELAAVLTTNPNSQNVILDYFVGCPGWTETLWTIRILCALFDADEGVCFTFLRKLNSANVIDKNEMVSQMLVVMTWRLNRGHAFINPCLSKEFRDSPFSEFFELSETIVTEKSAKGLYQLLAKMDISVVFSLRIDFEVKWKDRSLAEELLQMHDLDHSLSKVLNVLMDISDSTRDQSEIPLRHIPEPIKKPSGLLKALSALKKRFSHFVEEVCPKFSKDKWDDSGILYSIPAFQEKNAVKVVMNGKKWSSLWSSLIIENGPWDSGGDRMTHWMRDRTQCFGYCPVKLKRNNRFDTHEDASRARDSGKAVVTQDEEVPLTSAQNFFESNCILDAVDAVIVKPAKELNSRFRVCLDKIEIITDSKYVTIELNTIRGLHKRTWNHQETAMEIFTAAGPSYFIHFPNLKMPVSHVISKIATHCPKVTGVAVFNTSFRSNMESNPGKQDWIEGRISNFEYLMLLNVMSGRTFNDIAQYPLFPWVMKRYDTEFLDLSDESLYRDLGLPLGAMNKQRLAGLEFNYHEMESEGATPYLYSSGPISPLSVSLLLLRMEPFTTSHIELQGNRFDASDRMFFSIQETYNILVSSLNEYWELPPEFYFCPEFLENLNNFDLGVTAGAAIGDVQLPKWAASALEFIYFHRKVLESDHVSQSLHKWIDLIWGVHQNDKSANNVYHPYLYETVWDDIDIIPEVAEPYVRMVGQIPPRLFKDAHEPKTPIQPFMGPPFSLPLNGVPRCGVCCKSLTSSTVMLYFVFNDNLYSMSFGMEDEKLFIIRPVMKTLRLSASLTDIRSVHGGIMGRNGDCLFYFVPEEGSFTQTLISTEGVIVTDANSGEWVSTSTDDFTTTIFSTKKMGSEVGQFRSYRGSVVCSAISDVYKIHVMGTSDGILVLTSLASMEQFRVIDLEDRKPHMIEITPVWGFIVVWGSRTENGRVIHYLMAYTINGKKVREAPLLSGSEITQHIVFASDRGFDYFAYVSKTKLYVCEVFFLNQREITDRFLFSSVEWLEYHRGVHSFLIIDGKDKERSTLLAIPFVPDDFLGLRDEMKKRREVLDE